MTVILQCLISILFFLSSTLAFFLSSSRMPECVEPPKICPNKNISFFLYTSTYNDLQFEMNIDKGSTIMDAPFISGAPIKFLLHGYTGHKDYAPNPQLRKAYFERDEPVNIISIHYENLVKEGCYTSAVTNSDLVANCTAQFFDELLDKRSDISLDQFHIIGLSLGAQVAGQIHTYFHKGPFKRITGLDPAAPLFYALLKDDSKMLSTEDAQFVDVLHTNAGMRGKLLPIGHVDFYANLGLFQPGCGFDSSCSHERAVDYYAESINSNVGFWGYNCSDLLTFVLGQCLMVPHVWNVFGEYCNPSLPGLYHFTTNRESPYAMGRRDQ